LDERPDHGALPAAHAPHQSGGDPQKHPALTTPGILAVGTTRQGVSTAMVTMTRLPPGMVPTQSGPTWENVPSSAVKPTWQQYKPRGAVKKLMACRDPEVLIDGPAGTGKSLGILHKLHAAMLKYPGARGQIARKYRKSLTDSALVTYEEEVLGPGNPIRQGPRREQRHIYYYPAVECDDGVVRQSTITITGLDESEKQKSSQYDMTYIQEATEIGEDDLANIIRGQRNNLMPYQQIMMDVNPDAPMHWLKLRFERGDCTRLQSFHEDNPALWDEDRQEWTEFGARYIAGLDRLVGVMKLRLRYGIWAAAEGAVYDVFDPTKDVVEPFDIPDYWPRRVGLDFGGVNTGAMFYAKDIETGIYYGYREYVAGNRTAGDHAFYLRLNEPERLFVVGGSRSEGQWRLEFGRVGLTVLEPPKISLAQGITRVYGQHKRSNIKIFSTCHEYLKQKSDYRYKPDFIGSTEAIENQHAYHLLDAERYIIARDFPERDPERTQSLLDQLDVVKVW
jgi:Phage terminase large subunit